MNYIPDRIARDRADSTLAGRAGALPAGRRQGLPVGQPRDHRAQPARPRGRHLAGAVRARRTTSDSWTFDLDPDGVDPVLGIHRLQEAYFDRIPGYPRGITVPAIVDVADRPGGHQRLPVDHPRPVLRVAASTTAPDAPDLWPAELPRGDGGGDGAGLHRGQQRRLPLRVRRLAGGVRRGLRPALGRDGLARGAARRPPLPDGRRRSPRPTYACSRRWPASTRSTTATSSATATSSPRCRTCGATPATCYQTPGFGETIDFDQIKQHYYVVHSDVNPSGIVPKGPDTDLWLQLHDRDRLG